MQDPKEKIFFPSIEYFSYYLHHILVGGKKSLAHYRKRCAGGRALRDILKTAQKGREEIKQTLRVTQRRFLINIFSLATSTLCGWPVKEGILAIRVKISSKDRSDKINPLEHDTLWSLVTITWVKQRIYAQGKSQLDDGKFIIRCRVSSDSFLILIYSTWWG